VSVGVSGERGCGQVVVSVGVSCERGCGQVVVRVGASGGRPRGLIVYVSRCWTQSPTTTTRFIIIIACKHV